MHRYADSIHCIQRSTLSTRYQGHISKALSLSLMGFSLLNAAGGKPTERHQDMSVHMSPQYTVRRNEQICPDAFFDAWPEYRPNGSNRVGECDL